jgi:hypothetical protein
MCLFWGVLRCCIIFSLLEYILWFVAVISAFSIFPSQSIWGVCQGNNFPISNQQLNLVSRVDCQRENTFFTFWKRWFAGSAACRRQRITKRCARAIFDQMHMHPSSLVANCTLGQITCLDRFGDHVEAELRIILTDSPPNVIYFVSRLTHAFPRWFNNGWCQGDGEKAERATILGNSEKIFPPALLLRFKLTEKTPIITNSSPPQPCISCE